ncbi:MAG: hypothetical protein RL365_290 [Bacteroidota bacterium]|jgi:hypothetical protein
MRTLTLLLISLLINTLLFTACFEQGQKPKSKKEIKQEKKLNSYLITGRERLEIEIVKLNSNKIKINIKDSVAFVSVQNDSTIINAIIKHLALFKQVPPKSAYYKYKNGNFKIEPEILGSTIDTVRFIYLMKDLLKNKPSNFDLEKYNCYRKPEILSEDAKLKSLLPKLTKMLSVNINYSINGENIHLDKNQLGKMITTNEKGKISIDENECYKFINGMAKKYDNIEPSVSFKSHQNKSLPAVKSELGKRMNVNGELKKLMRAIETGESLNINPSFLMNGVPYDAMNRNRNYIEIDISEQKIYCFKQDTIFLSSDIVTGNVSAGMSSPKGAFFIKYKETGATLRGPGYSAFVNYWMPFFEGVGLHDAKWRSSFGGSIYMGSGSHGCINLPFATAKSIYENYGVGSVVVCH